MNRKKRIISLLLAGMLVAAMAPAAPAADILDSSTNDSAVVEQSGEPQHNKQMLTEGVQLRTDHAAYMQGYADGSFGPNEQLTWAQICSIVYHRLQDQTMGSHPYTYTDVRADAWYYQAISVLASQGILSCDGGAFHPNQLITRGEFVQLAVGFSGIEEDATCSFTDVDPDDPYYSAIATAVQKGWINGFADGTFRPNDALTRVQAVSVFNSLFGRHMDETIVETAPDTLRTFIDVAPEAWYYNQVMEATIDHDGVTDADGVETWRSYTHSYPITLRYSGISQTQNVYEGNTPQQIPKRDNDGKLITHWLTTDGSIADVENTAVYQPAEYTAWYAPELKADHIQYVYGYGDGTFGPNDALTRAQACMLLYSLLEDQTKGTANCTFTDVGPDSWYYRPITVLASKQIISGGGAYRPKDEMKRGEFVEMVARLTSYTFDGTAFPDVPKDHPYYNAIATAVANGWVSGFDDGNFYPDRSLTRAQAVTILNKVAKRTGDAKTAQLLDSQYIFTDVKKSFWGYTAIMEAATTHTYRMSYGDEVWMNYTQE
ncbi:MAG: S-layer homology domain-containing protein [Eubacteriales bacterium]|nr:S-layer homology domain-containing protein [Eubacteriales bacterium]